MPRVSSARCGTCQRGCTAARNRGRSPSRAMAKEVRPTPAMSARSAPSEAAAAPMRTTGSAHAHPGCRHHVGDRLGGARRRLGAERREHRDRDRGVDEECAEEGEDDGAGDRPSRIPDLLAHRRDPRIAGEGEEEQSRRLQDAVPPAGRQVGRCEPPRRVWSRTGRRHRDGQRQQHDDDDDPRELRGAGDPEPVDRHERRHRGDGNRALPAGRRRVGREGEGHRGAARGLPDHEAPSGDESPPGSELRASVRVGAARGGVHRGELRR